MKSGARPKTKLRKSKPLLLQIHHNSGTQGASLKGETEHHRSDQKAWLQQLEREDNEKDLQVIMDEETARKLVDEDVVSKL